MVGMLEMVELLAMFGAAFVLSLGTMLVAWVIYVFQRKASIADVGWAVGFLACAWAYFFIGYGYAPKRWAITLMASFWAIRLGKHVFERYRQNSEDGRYSALRARWGGDGNNILFLMMFLLQGALVVILSVPFLVVSYAAHPGWTAAELFGFLIWALGVSGEAIADYQLAQFKADPANHSKVLSNGFWRYSRHPNYFFEWVVWVGFFLFAFSSPGGWLAVLAPMIMYGLLTQGTAIPFNEAQALRTKGEAYRRYQRATPLFFPWLPQEAESSSESPSPKEIAVDEGEKRVPPDEEKQV